MAIDSLTENFFCFLVSMTQTFIVGPPCNQYLTKVVHRDSDHPFLDFVSKENDLFVDSGLLSNQSRSLNLLEACRA